MNKIKPYFEISVNNLSSDKKTMAIIGSGLSGSALVYQFSKLGFKIDLYDKNSEIASESSSNPWGILQSHFSVDNNISDEFHSLGFEKLITLLNDNCKNNTNIYIKSGLIKILDNNKKLEKYKKIIEHKKNISNENISILTPIEASIIAKTKIEYNCFYVKNASKVSPKKLCEKFLSLSKYTFIHKSVKNLQKNTKDNKWLIDNEEYDFVILANAQNINKFTQTKNLNVSTLAGQITIVKDKYKSDVIIQNTGYAICYKLKNEAYALLGVSYRQENSNNILPSENDDNMNILKQSPILKYQLTDFISNKVGIRCVTKDHILLYHLL